MVSAQAANHWRQGDQEVWVLQGDCRIHQGAGSARARQAVLWIEHAAATSQQSKVTAYLEGDVVIQPDSPDAGLKLTDQTWFGSFETRDTIRVYASQVAGEPDVKPAIYLTGMKRRRPDSSGAIRRTQFEEEVEPGEAMPLGTRRVEIFPRSNTPVQARWDPDPNSNLWTGVVDGGVTMMVHTAGEFGVLDISADRLVVWTVGRQEPDTTGQTLQSSETPLEIYMEGNIVFRQEDRVIYASRMYYDLTNKTGRVLDAELLTPVPQYEGMLRLRADVLQQTGQGRYLAQNSFITSSRMGRPGYRMQASEVYFEDLQSPAVEPFSGQPIIDPQTGEQVIHHQRLATSRNSFLFLGEVPIFYWPILATDLTDPTFYIRGVRIKKDRVYGPQLLTTWDAYELFGIRNPPAGTDWDLSLDYLGDRGLGHGTTFLYNRDGFLRLPGPTSGLIDYWAVKDKGLDNLGQGRRRLVPEEDYRYRLFWQHRQQLPGDLRLTGELGWISDRNFLEEYYEREWDELKDQTTGVELKRTRDNISFSVSSDLRVNDFFTQTDWLPRADHFQLGQSVFNDVFTWYEHSSVGYARYKTADAPISPKDRPWSPLAWEIADTQGERLVTRQEIDWPLQLGPVKAVPYALGELGHWGEDLTGDDIQRFYWQVGMRASMPIWTVNPWVENSRWNVHGLAHKVVFDAELSMAESNRDMRLFPLYDPLDDDSVEAFRRRLSTSTFGGPPIPSQFDSRSYALRTGLGGWVTSPSTEVADDMMAVRMGMRHRWQTKRGMPGNRRILDWIVLDTNATWFPDNEDDNFGEPIGLLDYDFRWHVGDRLTLLSDGLFDFFPDGQQLLSVGAFLSRPPRGRLYVGLRVLEGPVSRRILSTSYSYKMSPKWLTTFGTSFDISGKGNIGQRFSITRIGESLLVSAGFTVDAARDNVGVQLSIEPRFLPMGRLGRAGGARIPVAGAFGLE